ncbi:hypothetical protein ACXR2U_19000 [Jatrophihabitans sp. YIM 134969]
MRRAQVTVGLLVVLLAVYLGLVTQRGVALVTSGDAISVVLGVAVFVFPLIGILLVTQEIRFGAATARLARSIDPAVLDADEAEVNALPRTASGRVERVGADALFALRRADAEAAPDDPVAWYRLAQAYDLAGDRKRARGAMRHALSLVRT